MLYEFITLNREEIIRRCRAKVATRSTPPPTDAEIDHGVPLFLDQLVDLLRSGGTTGEIDKTAGQHGHDLLLQGFTVSQVIHDYGDVCQTVTGLAVETDAPISTEDFQTLNRCLDDAIAGAVTTYTAQSQRSLPDPAGLRYNERYDFLVHEMRNLVSTAVVAFEVLKTGNVGVGGSIGAVLSRTLSGLEDLIARSLEEIRVTNAVKDPQRILVSSFVEEIGAAATLEANARGLTLIVTPVEEGLVINVDRQILAAVTGNLLQNAFKFTRPHSTVTLSVHHSTDRVLLEVHDQCGGLPGAPEGRELDPSFQQHGVDRSGLGIGLTFCRWGTEANGGRLYARNMPGAGCVFTVDLPRAPSALPASA